MQGCRINQNEISFGGTGLSAVGLGVLKKLRSMMSNALYNSTLSNDLLDSIQVCGAQLLCPKVKDVLYQLLIQYKELLASSAQLSNYMPNSELVLKLCPKVKDALYQLIRKLLLSTSKNNESSLVDV